MKIRLLQNLPIDSSHEMTKGKVYTVISFGQGRSNPRWYVMSDKTDTKIGVYKHEAEICEEES